MTAAVYGNGIRVHTKTSEGFVREVGNDTTRKQFADAMRRGDVGTSASVAITINILTTLQAS